VFFERLRAGYQLVMGNRFARGNSTGRDAFSAHNRNGIRRNGGQEVSFNVPICEVPTPLSPDTAPRGVPVFAPGMMDSEAYASCCSTLFLYPGWPFFLSAWAIAARILLSLRTGGGLRENGLFCVLISRLIGGMIVGTDKPASHSRSLEWK
jgi:hypothetical protein